MDGGSTERSKRLRCGALRISVWNLPRHVCRFGQQPSPEVLYASKVGVKKLPQNVTWIPFGFPKHIASNLQGPSNKLARHK